MSDDSGPVRRLSREAAAVHDEELARPWSHSSAKQALFEEVMDMALRNDTRTAALHPITERTRRPRVPHLVAAASVVTALSLGLFTALELRPSDGAGINQAAADTLTTAGATAAAQPALGDLSAGQYWFTRTEGTSFAETDDGFVQEPYVYENWDAADGTGRIIRTDGSEAPWEIVFDGSAPATSPDGGATEVGGTRGFTTGHGQGTYQDLVGLPTDADALYEHFEREVADYEDRPRDIEMFVLVGDVLREPAPPALRAALFQVAARIPGVELVGAVTDGLGRPGIAVAMDDETGELRDELIVDEVTSSVLGERRVLQEAVGWTDLPVGATVSEAVVASSGIVGSVTARP